MPLTADQIRELWPRILAARAAGDAREVAKLENELAEGSFALLAALVRMRGLNPNDPDHWSEALLSMALAIRRYDPARAAWSTYLAWYVTRARSQVSRRAARSRRERPTTDLQGNGDGLPEPAAPAEAEPLDAGLFARAWLTDREALVIRERFDGGRTLSSIGRDFGLSRERMRQVEAKALAKLLAAFERLAAA